MKTKTLRVHPAVALLSVFFCCLAGVGALAMQSPQPGARPSAQRVARIPFELNGSMIFLQVRVNDSRPLWFALDTGAYNSILNLPVAQSLDLKSGRAGTTTGAGGQVQSVALNGLTFDVGGAPLKDLNIAALQLASIENSTGRAMDGILGAEFFRRYVVEIDYVAKEISLYEPAAFQYGGRGESLPLTFYDNHPYVRAKVELPGRTAIEGEFVIDAGSNLPLILMPSFVEQHRLRDSLPPTLKSYGRGVGGEVALPVGRAASLHLGGFRVERPLTAFPPAGTFGRDGKAGNIGSAVLRRFKVTFDYSRRRMILEPNAHFPDAFEHDMSGLQIVTEGPAFASFNVHRVLENSPAEEAGIKQGDRIVSFDGRPAAELRLMPLRELLRRPAKTYALQLKRGAETVSVQLKTRRLI